MVTWGGVTTFGQNPSATTAPTTPATPTTGGFSFGATTTTPATPTTPTTPGTNPKPTATTSVFGTPAAPAATGTTTTTGLFGAPAPATAAATAPSLGTGIFGTPTAAAPATGALTASSFSLTTSASATPTTTTSLFSTTTSTQANPQQAALLSQLQEQQRAETARISSSLLLLRSAYDPSSTTQPPSSLPTTTPERPFQHLFYDPKTLHQTQLPRPPSVDPKEWNEAMAKNPDPENLIPVVVSGAEALRERMVKQQDKATTLKGYVGQLTGALVALETSVSAAGTKVDYLTREHGVLKIKLLKVMRKVEVLRCMNIPLQRGEVEADRELKDLENRVEGVCRMFKGVKDGGNAYVRAMAATGGGRRGGGGKSGLELSEEDKGRLWNVLEEQRAGLDSLTKIVKKDERDLGIVKKEIIEKGNLLGLPPGLQ